MVENWADLYIPRAPTGYVRHSGIGTSAGALFVGTYKAEICRRQFSKTMLITEIAKSSSILQTFVSKRLDLKGQSGFWRNSSRCAKAISSQAYRKVLCELLARDAIVTRRELQ